MIDQIAALDSFIFDDSQPNIEASTVGVLLDTKIDSKYIDYKAFQNRWVSELDSIKKLDPLLAQGKQLVHNIYVYRSVSTAMQVLLPTATDETTMSQFYRQLYDILLPSVNKLKEMMKFVRIITQFFRGIVAFTKETEQQRFSENFLLKLIILLDILIKLDALKNSKKCLEVDFQAFQTASSFLQNKDPSVNANSSENHDLVLFLGHQNSIIAGVKTEVIKLDGYTGIISILLNLCLEMFENHKYILPEEKFRFLRVIPVCLYFLDTYDDPKRSLTKTKEHNLSQIQRLLKRWPVVPLCGDVYVVTTDVLKDSPSFRGAPEFFLPHARVRQSYDLRETLPQARIAHNEFVAVWQDAVINLRGILNDDTKARDDESKIPVAFAEELVNLTLRGFRLLGDWSSDLLAQTSFKYANPFKDDLSMFQLTDVVDNILSEDAEPGDKKDENAAPPPPVEKKNSIPVSSGKDIEGPTIAYERAVKFNYTSTERFATVEYMGLIKGVSSLMHNVADILVPVINFFIHHEIQTFIQLHLRDLIRKFTKNPKKKKFPQDELIELMNLAVDWKGGKPRDDPVLTGKRDQVPRPIPERSVPPSHTQVELIRTILWGFINLRGNKDIYAKSFSKYSRELKIFEDVLSKSFHYQYLLDFTQTISNTSNIGDLWLREYFLEQSGSTQFSIELSLPWILTNHVLEYAPKAPQTIVMMEYLLYPLSIYNDASTTSLLVYKKQHLFEEVEAEVNLAFDQLLYKLCSQVFTHYKILAASLQLDKSLSKTLEGLGPNFYAKFLPSPNRYHVLFAQRHFQLMGRSLDLNRLITQRMNNYFRENLQYALARFEASSITSILAFEKLLQNIRLTHQLMSEDLPQLDPFDEFVLMEGNESASLVSFHGRVVLHVLYELMGDFCGNFVFNSVTARWIRGVGGGGGAVPGTAGSITGGTGMALTPIVRSSMPKNNAQFLYGNRALSIAFQAVDGLHERFFGISHVKSLIRVLGLETLPLLVSEIIKNLEIKLKSAMLPYAEEMSAGMPQKEKTNLPFSDYGTEGTYGIFCSALTNLINYPVMVTKVFQMFREWGNCIILLKFLDTALADEAWSQIVHASSFLGIKSAGNKLVTPPSNPLEKAFASFSSISQNSTTKARDVLNTYIQNTKMVNNLYQPTNQNFSLFKYALSEIRKLIRSDWCWNRWTASEQSFQEKRTDNPLLPVEFSNEFYRIWSGMLFVFCLDIEENKNLSASSHEIHGDGFFWAGAVLVYFLNQMNRLKVFDYSLTVLRVSEYPQAVKMSESIIAFLHRVQLIKDINDSIFQQLQSSIPPETPVIRKIVPKAQAVPPKRPTQPTPAPKGLDDSSSFPPNSTFPPPLPPPITTSATLPPPLPPPLSSNPPPLPPFSSNPPPFASNPPPLPPPLSSNPPHNTSIPPPLPPPFASNPPPLPPPLASNPPHLPSHSSSSSLPSANVISSNGPPFLPSNPHPPHPNLPFMPTSILPPAPTPDLFHLPPAPTPDFGALDFAPPPPEEFAPMPPVDFAPAPPVEFAPAPPKEFAPPIPMPMESAPLPPKLPTRAPAPRAVPPTPVIAQIPPPTPAQDSWDPFGDGNLSWPSAPAPVTAAPLPAIRTVVKPARSTVFMTPNSTNPPPAF